MSPISIPVTPPEAVEDHTVSQIESSALMAQMHYFASFSHPGGCFVIPKGYQEDSED
jgi:hypothetical protein